MANDLADSLLTDGPFAAAKEQIAARSDRFELQPNWQKRR